MTMTLACESCNWCSSSRAVYRGLTFTQVWPERRMPAMVTANWGMFGSMIATREPGSKLSPCSHAAKATECESNCAYDIHWFMQTEKGLVALRLNDSSSKWVSDW